jgi:hypothetical protein
LDLTVFAELSYCSRLAPALLGGPVTRTAAATASKTPTAWGFVVALTISILVGRRACGIGICYLRGVVILAQLSVAFAWQAQQPEMRRAAPCVEATAPFGDAPALVALLRFARRGSVDATIGARRDVRVRAPGRAGERG